MMLNGIMGTYGINKTLPTIMHAIASVIMGLFLSKALFSNQTVTRRVFLAFLIPVLFQWFL